MVHWVLFVWEHVLGALSHQSAWVAEGVDDKALEPFWKMMDSEGTDWVMNPTTSSTSPVEK